MYVPLHGDLDGSRPGAAETEEVRHNKEMHCKRIKERDNIVKMECGSKNYCTAVSRGRIRKKMNVE